MPGFFGNQAKRLMREFWDAMTLAQELYAMFGSEDPMVSTVPVEINLPYDGPAITIRRPEGSTTDPIRVVDGGTDTALTSSGTTVINRPTETADYQPKSGAVLGQIVGGSGGSYTVAVYENGYSSGPTQTVSCAQAQIASDASIPPGTFTLVGFAEQVVTNPPRSAADVRREWYMQVPVWLE